MAGPPSYFRNWQWFGNGYVFHIRKQLAIFKNVIFYMKVIPCFNENSSPQPITFKKFLSLSDSKRISVTTEYNLFIYLLLCSILEVLWFPTTSNLHACSTFHLKLRPASWSRVSTNRAWDSWWVSNGFYKIKLRVRRLSLAKNHVGLKLLVHISCVNNEALNTSAARACNDDTCFLCVWSILWHASSVYASMTRAL